MDPFYKIDMSFIMSFLRNFKNYDICFSKRVGSGSRRCPPTPPGIRFTYRGGFYQQASVALIEGKTAPVTIPLPIPLAPFRQVYHELLQALFFFFFFSFTTFKHFILLTNFSLQYVCETSNSLVLARIYTYYAFCWLHYNSSLSVSWKHVQLLGRCKGLPG